MAKKRYKKIRVGAIGAGGNMGGHLNKLSSLGEVELVAMADPSAASIERMRSRVKATADLPTFRDHRKMLAKVEMDGVVISSPHTVHYQQLTDCLDAGLHILSEKPLVCSVVERTLTRQGVDVLRAHSVVSACEQIDGCDIDAVISDFRLGDGTGDEILRWVERLSPGAVRVLISAYAREDVVRTVATSDLVHRFFRKPFDAGELLAFLRARFDAATV